jgi:hypothetical protein
LGVEGLELEEEVELVPGLNEPGAEGASAECQKADDLLPVPEVARRGGM